MTFAEIYLWFLIFTFGVIIGSFINVVIFRLPKENFLKNSRSYCPSCKTTIKAYDLFPIVSYLVLGGKCRYCKEKISARYPIIELLCGMAAVFSVLRFDFTLNSFLVFGVIVILVAITMIDFDTLEIPNQLVIALIPFAIWATFLFKEIPLNERVIGFFAVSLPMLIMTLIIKSAFGGGDIKLIAVCGFLLGWQNLTVAFFISLLLGGGYAIFLLVTKKNKKNQYIAFGPYICVGVVTAMFFGNEIINWYLSFFY